MFCHREGFFGGIQCREGYFCLLTSSYCQSYDLTILRTDFKTSENIFTTGCFEINSIFGFHILINNIITEGFLSSFTGICFFEDAVDFYKWWHIWSDIFVIFNRKNLSMFLIVLKHFLLKHSVFKVMQWLFKITLLHDGPVLLRKSILIKVLKIRGKKHHLKWILNASYSFFSSHPKPSLCMFLIPKRHIFVITSTIIPPPPIPRCIWSFYVEWLEKNTIMLTFQKGCFLH